MRGNFCIVAVDVAFVCLDRKRELAASFRLCYDIMCVRVCLYHSWTLYDCCSFDATTWADIGINRRTTKTYSYRDTHEKQEKKRWNGSEKEKFKFK